MAPISDLFRSIFPKRYTRVVDCMKRATQAANSNSQEALKRIKMGSKFSPKQKK